MPNDINYQEVIEKDIFDILGAKNMSDDQKQKIITKALETIQTRAMMRISDKLSEADVSEWKKIIDSKGNTEAAKFLESKGIDVAKILLEEALIYKTELAQLMKKSR